ncbi:hypothetical protein [Streptomyces sp. MP131-18]|uniref:hypothetical protein n=1 Tax=Streptomyces sp. MP131-18 TaxID=1857892 RepID=UPI00097CA4DC|nr:hypothetical protein [Streptomyces sp. MP131-18]ONK14401.1 hypothetical protein STBA_51860 [Streptomyces sp. MP131-18]
MRTRTLRFGLYADEQGLAWVRGLVDEAVAARSARVVARTAEPAATDLFGGLAEQWAWEHPGRSSGARRPVELRVRVVCSLRTWRALRKTVIRTLCPEGAAPHACRVPWFAA